MVKLITAKNRLRRKLKKYPWFKGVTTQGRWIIVHVFPGCQGKATYITPLDYYGYTVWVNQDFGNRL